MALTVYLPAFLTEIAATPLPLAVGGVGAAAEDSLCLRAGGSRDSNGRGEHGQRDFILAKVRTGGHGCGILLARRGARADSVLRIAVLDADGIHEALRHSAGFGVSPRRQ